MKEYYNYIYLDPRKPGKYEYQGLDFCLLYEPFYVGKGTGKRYLDHIKEANKNKLNINQIKINKIRKILNEEYKLEDYIIIFNHTINEEKSFENEVEIINLIGINNLTNITSGGFGGYSNISTYFDISSNSNIKLHREEYNKNKERYYPLISLYKRDDIKGELYRLPKGMYDKEVYVDILNSEKVSWGDMHNTFKIYIYDIDNNLKYISDCPISEYLTKYNLPTMLIDSYQNNGSPIHRRYKDSIFHGWYALKEGESRDSRFINKKVESERGKFKVTLYNSQNEAVKVKPKEGSFKSFCEEVGIQMVQVHKSIVSRGRHLYSTKRSLNNKFRGWYALKDDDVQDIKWVDYDYDEETLKNVNLVAKINNSSHQRINVYNDKNELVFTNPVSETFKSFCKNNKLPYNLLCKSYRNNIKLLVSENSYNQVDDYTKSFRGWYALKVED